MFMILGHDAQKIKDTTNITNCSKLNFLFSEPKFPSSKTQCYVHIA